MTPNYRVEGEEKKRFEIKGNCSVGRCKEMSKKECSTIFKVNESFLRIFFAPFFCKILFLVGMIVSCSLLMGFFGASS